MHTTIAAVVNTATDLKQLRRGAELIENACDLTASLNELTSLHLLAEDAKGAVGKFMAAIDPDASGGHKAVEDAAEKEGQT